MRDDPAGDRALGHSHRIHTLSIPRQKAVMDRFFSAFSGFGPIVVPARRVGVR
jgi:hypothetical protein